MQRTTIPPKRKEFSDFSYIENDESIILSKLVLDILLNEKNPSDLIGLYCFYYYTAKWQKTNRPKATANYVASALGWGIDKIRNTKKALRELGLIQDITDFENGKITHHYVQVNFIWKRNNHPLILPTLGEEPPRGKIHTQNALSPDIINALSSNINQNASSSLEEGEETRKEKKNLINPSMFEKFWEIYPRHSEKGKTLTCWKKLCNKKDRPAWSTIKKALLAQKETERWVNPKFIPLPPTWLNQSRWLDDPECMVSFDSSRNDEEEIIELADKFKHE